MRATLPFASGGLRDLAAIWQADLARPMPCSERDALSARLAEVYLQILQTEPEPAERNEVAVRLLALHRAAPLGARLLEAVADAADEQGDNEIRRRVLECLSRHEDPQVKARALEHLGDVLDQLGERRAAVDSWKPAAQMRSSFPSDHAHARRIYERVLDTAPNDRDTAERLIELYAEANAWDRIPEVFGIIVRGDADRAAELLLRLEAGASRAGALGHLVTMVDEALALRAPYSATSRSLRQAKARALAATPAQHAEAAATYRALLEMPKTAQVDEDVCAYDSFIATLRDPAARHSERRWLYQWRAQNGDHPAETLVEWAKAEEAFGEREQAIAAYRRAIDAASEKERPALTLHAAHLLDEVGRPEEAIVLLAPTLTLAPRVEAAHTMARAMLGDPRSGMVVANQLEGLANEASDPAGAGLFALLVEARAETIAAPEARRRWWQCLVHRSLGAPAVSLAVLVQGAADAPSELDLWAAAERVARACGALDRVLCVYGETLARGDVDGSLAEVLGRRMVALEAECAIETPQVVEALSRVLDLAPHARWALDRIKLAFGREGRWEELFRAYDKAIGAAGNDDQRAELLDEAAFAARDLASDPERAIRYLCPLHALRPADAAVSTALERLYEREGRKVDLIAMLAERAARSEASARRDLRRRVAVLWLELGRAGDASATLDTMIHDGVSIADVADLLERVAECPGQREAIEHLNAYYESVGQIDDVVRIAEGALARAEDGRERRHRIRELVRYRITAAQSAPRALVQVAARLESDVDGDTRLGIAAYRALLVRAIAAWKQAPTDAAFEDAAEGAWCGLQNLKTLFIALGDTRGASRLLERGARLRFERRRQRVLLHEAVVLSAESADSWDEDHDPRAMRIIAEIFREDSGDAIAASLLDRFAALLDAAGAHEALADLWEDQARHRAKNGDQAGERACWERAAALWEERGATERAVAAYDRGAALGSRESFVALARIHTSRGDWQEAAAALERVCAFSPEAQHIGRLADAYIKLGRTDCARACVEQRLATSPPPAEAGELHDRLSALYRRDGAFRPLADLLAEQALRAERGETRAALLEEASSILETKLDAPAEAAALLERAIHSDPREGSLRTKLGTLRERLGHWDRAVEIYEQQIALYGEQRSKERALAHHRLARALVRMGRGSDALGELVTAAKMLPTHPAILHELGQAALAAKDFDLAERTYRSLLLTLRNAAEPDDGIGSTQVLLELAAIASQKGDARRAANLLESALDRAHDVTERALAVGRLAELWNEPLGRDAELGARVRGYAEMIAVELRRPEPHRDAGSSGTAWTTLVRVHITLGDEATLRGLLEEAIANTAGGDRAQLRIALAKMWVDDPDQTAAVMTLLAGALEESPADSEAADLFAGVLERARRFDELATLLERRLPHLERATPAYARVQWRLAHALERAERQKDAMLVYESLLDVRPIGGDTVRALFERLDALGSVRIADCLELRIDLEPEPAGDLVSRLVELREARGDRAGLVRALERAVDAAPANSAHLRRLVDAYRTMGHERQALRLLDGAAARNPHDAEILCLRAGVREAMGDHDGAASDLRRIGGDAPCVDAAVAIMDRIVAAAALTKRDALELVLADILLGARRLDRARDVLEALLARDPNHAGALERVASLATAERTWDRAIDAYARLARIVETSDPSLLGRFIVALVDACDRAGRPADARDPLERARRALPDDAQIERRLERVCEQTSDYERLSELLSARAERSADPAEKATLLLRAASVIPEGAETPSRALALVERARTANPTSIEAAVACAKIYATIGRPRDAATLLTEVAERNRGKRLPILADVHLELGKAHLAKDELVEAHAALKEGFAVDFRGREIALLLGLVSIDLDDDKTAERALLAVAMLPPRSDSARWDAGAITADQASALYHLASLAYAKGELTKSRSWAGKAVALAPTHEGALALLERLEVRPLAAGHG